jgi:hypothetical protein
MEDAEYARLHSVLSRFPHVHNFLDDDFIKGQYEGGLKNWLLRRLTDEQSRCDAEQHLPTLESRLSELARPSGQYNGAGYGRLAPLLRKASDWDQYQETLAQIDITLWFNEKGLLKEIEPELSFRNGKADILLSFSGQDIYCECTSFQSITKSLASKASIEGRTIQTNARRRLLRKADSQLPPDHPSILVLDMTKSTRFVLDERQLAEGVFPQRPQIALMAVWDCAFNWSTTPRQFFVNTRSNFREVGEALLRSLGLKGELVG